MHKQQEPAVTLVAPASPVKMRVRSPFGLRVGGWRRVLMIGDLVSTGLAVFFALIVWAQLSHGHFSLGFMINHWYWFLLLPPIWIFLAVVNDFYRLRQAALVLNTLRALVFINLQFAILYTVIFFFVPRNLLPRLFVLCFVSLAFVITALSRISRAMVMRGTDFRRRVVIVGTGQIARMMMLALKEEASKEYEVVGCVTSVYDVASLPGDVEVLGFGQELLAIVRQQAISEVVMAYINEIPADVFDGLVDCYQQGVLVIPMPRLYEEVTGRVPIEHIGQRLWSLVLPVKTQSLGRKLYGASKRMSDIVGAIVGLILFTPFFPLIATLIKLDSAGPVFYFQRRVGQGGRIFTIIKLRTMVVGAEKNSGPIWASPGDLRATRVGRFLRRTRIDEIPQLINVLRGDMSIVGPRPERPEFVEMLAKQITFYKTRLVAKPGLTGWAQIRYRYGNSLEDALDKLQLDLYYIRHQSLMLDLIIALRTLAIVLRSEGF